MNEPPRKKKQLGRSRHAKPASEPRSPGLGFTARLLAEIVVRAVFHLMDSDWFNLF